jgi:hypothetical protein
MKDACEMIKSPKLCLVYIYAMGGAGVYRDKALQFVESYVRNPPGLQHETLIVCNGVSANADTQKVFEPLGSYQFLDRDDAGWDIGGYQAASRALPADLMIFCGGHTYFRKPGWLARLYEVFAKTGPGLYGATGNQGDLRVNVHPHVRTTGFWCPPWLMRKYPHEVTQRGGGGQRYEFEHGEKCLSNFARSLGLPRLIVGWNDVKPLEDCNAMAGGFHNGDQHNVLIGDRLTQKPYGSD